MHGRLVGPYTTQVSFLLSSLTPFIVIKYTLVWLTNVTLYLFGWLPRFGPLLVVNHILNLTLPPVLVPLLSYHPFQHTFFLLPLLFLSLLLSSLYPYSQLARYLLYLSCLCNVVSENLFYSSITHGTHSVLISKSHSKSDIELKCLIAKLLISES